MRAMALGIGLAAWAWPSFALCAGEARWNVLFIAVDDLRPDLGCYGAADIRTPNIDRLAARGLLFDRAYCQVAVCNPSRCSVLGGVRADTARVLNNQTFLRPMMPDVVTLPQHFKNSGYYSVSLGKVFHHSEREPGDDPESWSEPAWYHGEPHRTWMTEESAEFIRGLKALPEKRRPRLLRGPPFEAADEPDDVYPDGQTAAKAIETLGRLKDRAFFLAVGFVKPHLPFNCPRRYWDLYPPETIRLPENHQPPEGVPGPALHNWYELRTYGTVPPEGDIPRDMALNLIRGYRACITFVDAQVGRVLDELGRLGLEGRTVVVLWGDHGYHLGENGIWTKMTNFERGTRVPLILSAPGQANAGRRSGALVELVDIYPTLAGLCGLPPPGHLEGLSLEPLLEDPDRPWKAAVFSQYLRPGKDPIMGRSVRTDRWRYTEWTNAREEKVGVELYDERDDPEENVNVVGEAANGAIALEMAVRLRNGWRGALPGSAHRVGAGD